jgi:hypothetical protein
MKLKLDLDDLEILIPGAKQLETLPRKRKKSFKKELVRKIDLLLDNKELWQEYFDNKDE